MDNESAASFTTTQLVGLCLLNIQISKISKRPLDPQANWSMIAIP